MYISVFDYCLIAWRFLQSVFSHLNKFNFRSDSLFQIIYIFEHVRSNHVYMLHWATDLFPFEWQGQASIVSLMMMSSSDLKLREQHREIIYFRLTSHGFSPWFFAKDVRTSENIFYISLKDDAFQSICVLF